MAYTTAKSHNTYAEIWQSTRDHLWYWHICANGNHEPLARSSEGYTIKPDALYGLRLFYNGPVYDR
jgi:hypothetical protein